MTHNTSCNDNILPCLAPGEVVESVVVAELLLEGEPVLAHTGTPISAME